MCVIFLFFLRFLQERAPEGGAVRLQRGGPPPLLLAARGKPAVRVVRYAVDAATWSELECVSWITAVPALFPRLGKKHFVTYLLIVALMEHFVLVLVSVVNGFLGVFVSASVIVATMRATQGIITASTNHADQECYRGAAICTAFSKGCIGSSWFKRRWVFRVV